MSQLIYALYNDDHVLLKGAQKLVDEGISVQNAYSPFFIHGLDKVLGVKWTRLAICAFFYGMAGVSIALLGMWYFMVYDWPQDIGGKPSFSFFENVLAFVPVTFEVGVLCAAHLMVITFLFRSWILPGVTPRNPDIRTTNDHFALEISIDRNHKYNADELRTILLETGALKVWENK